MKNLLLDKMSMTGVGMKRLREAIGLISGATECIPVSTNSAIEHPHDGIYFIENYDKENGVLTVIAGAAKQRMNIGTSKNSLIFGEKADEVIKEALSTSRMLLCFYGRTYFVSSSAFLTLAQRLDIGADALRLTVPERDFFIAQIMMRNASIWKLCVRSLAQDEKKMYKIFAVHTDKYEYISQELLLEICENLCSPDCEKLFNASGKVKKYEITHDFTSIMVEYPDAAKEVAETYGLEDMTPCIRISTSDTGKASFVFEALWKHGKSYSVCDSFSCPHRGENANRETLLPKISQKLFPNYLKLPERLLELMNYEIVPACKFDTGRESMIAFLKKMHKEIKFTKILTKRTEIRIRELIADSFDYDTAISAFDIAMCYLGLPERIGGLSKSDITMLERLCGNVPFAKSMTSGNKEEEEKDIYLTA